ncbi:MAG: hypothetical protein HY778_18360 [Betaproteobacteria bacterium]|nr:hypothetical protein [Betaproteobacteria bacterium]
MTRIAFLILAHNKPHQLRRLVDALQHPSFDSYVHIDARVAIEPFRHAGARFLGRRIASRWGHVSLVQAMLATLRHAMSHGDYDRYCLLTGADYPIKSNARILDTLGSSSTEFIECFTTSDAAWIDRYRFFHPLQWNESAGARALRRLARTPLVPVRRPPLGLTPYWGSTWWQLSGAAARYVVEFVDRHPQYLRYYRHVWIAEEMFFQTILGNSPFAQRMGPNLRYIDWSGNHVHPKLLVSEDFDNLAAADALFARKFDIDADRAIFDRIDAELRRDTDPT